MWLQDLAVIYNRTKHLSLEAADIQQTRDRTFIKKSSILVAKLSASTSTMISQMIIEFQYDNQDYKILTTRMPGDCYPLRTH